MFSSRKTAAPSTSYNLTKSLRFRSSASAYLNRTAGTSTNQSIATWSFWFKRGTLGTAQRLFEGWTGNSDTGNAEIEIESDNTLLIGGYSTNWLQTSQLFRDPSAWYHIVVAFDTTQATSSNRIKLYVNGSQVTAFSTAAYPSQNSTFGLNNNSSALQIGRRRVNIVSDSFLDGYLTEVNFIDGQALTPSSFGSTNALTGVWQPAKYTGTYGTNGFYLKFTDTTSTSTLGTDYSGNSNTWTVNNISLTAGTTYDSMTDVPTLTSATVANYCVINPLFTPPSGWTASAITAGNLNAAYSTGTISGSAASFCLTGLTGKYYWEATLAAAPITIGLTDPTFTYGIYALNNTATSVATIRSDGSNVQTGLAAFAIGGVVGVAVDMSANTVQFYYNNSAYGTAVTLSATAQASQLFPIFTDYGSAAHYSINANFGQQGFK